MNDIGIARGVDDLGRVVIPIELRRSMGIKVGDKLAITAEQGRIVLTIVEHRCVVCGSSEAPVTHLDKRICGECAQAIGAKTLRKVGANSA
ncbi:MAG: AbrB/MazE/SpoVT family DNA-binding domain-containing protein [Bacillota bacterium]|nr:AbrB/MazE/SpoVT family DNA-binding domain-containing protein [Bacillota bacterium]